MSVETEEFAAMLRELKERSGRSYGALATRLHVSTSTLHRYCNGAAVPTEYAPVERLARVCGAGGEELVELHRRWILADAARRREASPASAPAAATARPAPTAEPAPAPQPASAAAPPAPAAPAPAAPPEPGAAAAPEEEVTTVRPVAPTAEPRRRARRRVLLSATAVAALATVVSVLVLRHTGDTSDRSATGVSGPALAATAAPTGTPAATVPTPTVPTPTDPAATGPATAVPPAAASTPAEGHAPAPFRVTVLTDNWGSPCGQWFLSSRTPAQVGPPPDSTAGIERWAAAQHAVPAGHLRLQLTAQGSSTTPVVLLGANVRVVSTQPAPKWNAYTPGAGCGGELTPASFSVDLDAAQPRALPAPGREGTRKTPPTDFPYRVSNSDPQVIEVDATTRASDVSWYLDLVWSSGGQQDTLTVDDHGRPFRTAGLQGAPGYFHDGRAWAPTPTDG
ncbi:helix-turn-helix domain-containing protein [Kitasatospora sp. NPDC092039]|uniref:helix-turn-helix domain-containing protein n=1 Tax=Kitasatospora sp. NPDC092039 TaxID=3364086 RepID=UPI003807CC88